MSEYKWARTTGLFRLRDGAVVPVITIDGALSAVDPSGADGRDLQAWLDAGNVPDAADPLPVPETAQATPSIAVDAEFLRTIENAQTVTDVKMAILDAVKRQAQGG